MNWADVTGVLGLVVSIAGFSLTLVQLRKTRSAAERAVIATHETERRLARNSLLVLIPQLLSAESQLASQLSSGPPEDAIGAMVIWRHTAAQIQGIVDSPVFNERALVGLLASAIGLAAIAEQALGDRRPGIRSMRNARSAMSEASTSAATLLARLKTYTGDDA